MRVFKCLSISRVHQILFIVLVFYLILITNSQNYGSYFKPHFSIPLFKNSNSESHSQRPNNFLQRVSNGEQDPRHFTLRLPSMSQVSETLGALNVVGRYILQRTANKPGPPPPNYHYYHHGDRDRHNYGEDDDEDNTDEDTDDENEQLAPAPSNKDDKITPSHSPNPTHPSLVIQPEVDEQLGSALYTLGRNVLGKNVTDSLVPVVQTVNSFGKFLPPLVYRDGRIVLGSLANSTNDGGLIKDVICTTPGGQSGKCLDLSGCPSLLFDLGNLRKSLCFKALFVPGVCCPDLIDENPVTKRPIIVQTTPYEPAIAVTVSPTRRPTFTVESTTMNIFGSGGGNVFEEGLPTLDCGRAEIPSFRIVGGDKSTPGMWPWMAAIFLHGPKGTEFWCGGTLISKKYILTAAHCTKDQKQKAFTPRQFSVRLGDYDLVQTNDPGSPEVYRVVEIISHPDFSGMGFYNDVALLKLDRQVNYNKYISPICLPTGQSRHNNFVGTFATVIGWGTNQYGGRENNALQEVKLPVWSNTECDKTYFQPITDIFLCAGLPAGGKDACQGDSGGPLMLELERGKWTQIGIVSFGNRCAEPGYPGVYTRLTKFLDWIHTNAV